MNLTIDLDREDDGRWIAEVLELPGVMCYGGTRDESISNAERLAIEVIADRLEGCRIGKFKRLIICVPPRSLKSLSASVAFPAWLLGHNPSEQIICASYAQDLADKHAMDCRMLLTSDFYRGVFPTPLSPEKSAVSDFLTTRRGHRLSALRTLLRQQ